MTKKYDKQEVAKQIWMKYLENNEPPEGLPRDPEKHYGKHWKGWVNFLMKVSNKIEKSNEDNIRMNLFSNFNN